MTRLQRNIGLLCLPVVAAIFSISMGRDANWDFLNYRWYDPWAFLHHRLQSDVLVAEHATFYNPLLELPFYLLATHVRAIVAGFVLAFLCALPVIPLALLAGEALAIRAGQYKFLAALAVAGAGLVGGGVLGQIGIVSWDLPLATLTFSALYFLSRNGGSALIQRGPASVTPLLLAGLLSGTAAGLKLTAAIYPFGIAVALLAVSKGHAGTRLIRTATFSLGVVIGLLLFGGYWMWRLHGALGNPVFPYFNEVFHSAYAADGNNRDGSFLPHDAKTILLFPFLFTANSLLVAEYHFRDAHIAIVMAIGLPMLMFSALSKKFLKPNEATSVTAFLLVFFFASFAVWEYLFAIYRYILPLEMLSPLLIALVILQIDISTRAQLVAITLALLVAECFVSTGWNRRSWDSDYVAVAFPALPQGSMLLLTGNAPMGFAVTTLPDTVPALRIGSYLAIDNEFARTMHAYVASWNGGFSTLFSPGDIAQSRKALTSYGLAMDEQACQLVTSNVSDPLQLCRVVRK